MQRRRRRHAINNKLCAIQNKKTKSRVNITNYKNVTYVYRDVKKNNIHSKNKTKNHTSIQKHTHTHANQQNPIDLFFDAKVPALGPPCSGHVFAGSHPTVTGPELSVRKKMKKKKQKQNQVRERVSNNKKWKRCSIFL